MSNERRSAGVGFGPGSGRTYDVLVRGAVATGGGACSAPTRRGIWRVLHHGRTVLAVVVLVAAPVVADHLLELSEQLREG